jgi:hypothetical protein
MADSQVERERRRSVESGSSSGAGLASHRVWSLWKSGTSTHAEVCGHPLGHQLSVHMEGRLLFTSVHPTQEDAEREARALRQGALAEGWMDPQDPPEDAPAVMPAAGGRPED